MRDIFVLVPSLHPTGPVKGAVAFANAVAGQRNVTLVSLKGGPGVDAVLDGRVRLVSLAGNVPARVSAYRRILREAGGRPKVASLSCCLSADIVNVLCGDRAFTCASVRGNLIQNYRVDYGPVGVPVAMAHLAALRTMDRVVVMTASMAVQVARYRGKRPLSQIANFVDEAPLERYRNTGERQGPLRFVFVASLTPRKRPDLVIDALSTLRGAGVDAQLDLIGDGPLRRAVADQVSRHGLQDAVAIHGHLRDPYPLLVRADALVLPSLSEGLSRAALEALHLGVPCVLRDADGNAEVIQGGINGELFKRDSDIAETMLAVGRLGRAASRLTSLLPPGCRQEIAAGRYLELLETA